MTIDEIIAVLQAYKEGKKIEASNSGEWGYCKYPLWDFANWKYRIAPEPTKRYLIVNPEQVALEGVLNIITRARPDVDAELGVTHG